MGPRRLQLYWFPVGSTLAVALAPVLLDLPSRGVILRTSHGAQLGRFDTSSFVVWSIVCLAVVWSVQAATDRPRRPSPLSHHAFYVAAGVLYLDALFLLGSHARTAAEAGAPSWWIVGLAAAPWLGNHAAAKLEDARARSEGAWDTGAVWLPPAPLDPGAALWVGRREAWGHPWTSWLGLALLPSVVILSWTNGRLGWDALFLCFFIATYAYSLLVASVRVTVSQSGVRVEGGPFNVPLWRIPVDDLVEARVEEVRPRYYGGYGYRAKGGRRCLVVRAGPALLVRRRSGRDVLVTVEDADEGAALVNALVERRVPAVTGPS